MFEKDYLMRLFKEFLDGINEVLFHIKKEQQEQAQSQIEELYNKYFKVDRLFFHKNNAKIIINTLETTDIQASAIKCEMLAELLFIEGQLCTKKKTKKTYIKKHFSFLNMQKKTAISFLQIDRIKLML